MRCSFTDTSPPPSPFSFVRRASVLPCESSRCRLLNRMRVEQRGTTGAKIDESESVTRDPCSGLSAIASLTHSRNHLCLFISSYLCFTSAEFVKIRLRIRRELGKSACRPATGRFCYYKSTPSDRSLSLLQIDAATDDGGGGGGVRIGAKTIDDPEMDRGNLNSLLYSVSGGMVKERTAHARRAISRCSRCRARSS